MISYADALEIIARAVEPAPPRQVALARTAGAAAAADVPSATEVPPFANAAMDGFALRSDETRGAGAASPLRLRVAGCVAAGQSPPASTPAGSAWEIMTGAAMPADCDAVVPVERVGLERDAAGRPVAIAVREPLAPGQNRRGAGEDFRPGDRVLAAGTRLEPAAIMGLASIGCASVAVRSAPRIGVIATGSELVAGGEDRDGGRIRDANGPYLAAYLAQTGTPLVARRTCPDDPERLAAEIDALSRSCDILLTTGGVSAGSLDFVPGVVGRLGGEILFHRVAIRPGKPILLARLPGGRIVFGLPGNPMAVAVGLRFFVWPAVRRWMGMAAEAFPVARTAEAVRRHPTMTFFAKACARVTPEAVHEVSVLPGQESFRIAPLLRANCWAVVPPGTGRVEAGDLVAVAPLMPPP